MESRSPKSQPCSGGGGEHVQPPAAPEGRQQLELIADALPFVVFHLGTDLRHRFANAAYAQWFGFSRGEVEGRGLSEALGNHAFATLRPYLERALSGESSHFETVMPHRDGSTRAVRGSCVAHRDAAGEVESLVASLVDVSAERGRATEHQALPSAQDTAGELTGRAATAIDNARLLEEAREIAGTRDDFLSVAGHELRTPLTALQLQVLSIERMLLNPLDIEKLRVRAEKAARNVVRLSTLVNELLDISRISAGRLTLQHTHFDLSEPVSEVLGRMAGELTRAGCELDVNLEGELCGSWDRLRIEQVVTSLISNASKCAQGKPIEVRLTRRGQLARLSVRDYGPGLSLADQKRIFEPFERAVPSRSSAGLGLGLWTARQLVEAHGGTFSVHSGPNEGATFEVELALEPTDPEAIWQRS